MSSFEYADEFGDTLRIHSLGRAEAVAFAVRRSGDEYSVPVRVNKQDLPALVESLLETAGLDSYVLPKTGAKVVVNSDGWLSCGKVIAPPTANPDEMAARAADLVTVAEYIRNKEERIAAEQALETRRDALTQELTGSHRAGYWAASDLAQMAIDRIIAMQDKKEEDKNA